MRSKAPPRRRRRLRPSTLAPASSAPANAQQPGQTPADDDANTAPTIKVGVNEVNLIFTVTDKHGHYIPNLKLSDFALLDDQQRS